MCFRSSIPSTNSSTTDHASTTNFHKSDGSARMRCTSMSPSPSFSFLTLRSCRTCWGAARLPTPSAVTFRATRYHISTMPLPPPETQKMASTTAEPVGQSGCRYLIERVLQEKGNPPRRVYLATYVAPEAQLPTLSNLLTPTEPALETKSLY